MIKKMWYHVNQYFNDSHEHISLMKKKEKNPVFLLGMFKTSLEYYFIHSPTFWSPKKTSFSPVGLVMQTKQVFPPLENLKKKKSARKTEFKGWDWFVLTNPFCSLICLNNQKTFITTMPLINTEGMKKILNNKHKVMYILIHRDTAIRKHACGCSSK